MNWKWQLAYIVVSCVLLTVVIQTGLYISLV
jgi:hypothetical protein